MDGFWNGGHPHGIRSYRLKHADFGMSFGLQTLNGGVNPLMQGMASLAAS
jgi:hypothetical protein